MDAICRHALCMYRFAPILMIATLLLGCDNARNTSASMHKQEIQRKQVLLKQKEFQLEEAKAKQGAMQKLFFDSEDVNALQADIKAIKEGIRADQKEIRNLESGYSGALRKAIFAGFCTTLAFMVILSVAADASLFTSELSLMLGSFFLFWTVFSAVIKFIFY